VLRPAGGVCTRSQRPFASFVIAGSQSVFLAAETAAQAAQQAETLLAQCADTIQAAEIWALEDAVEFQSVALELLNAMSGGRNP